LMIWGYPHEKISNTNETMVDVGNFHISWRDHDHLTIPEASSTMDFRWPEGACGLVFPPLSGTPSGFRGPAGGFWGSVDFQGIPWSNGWTFVKTIMN
jgi:hypothetical protein